MNLNIIAKKIKLKLINLIYKSKTAHLGSSMSCLDILVSIYYSKYGLGPKINDKKNLKNTFILSKGHAAPALYIVLNKKKYISNKLLNSYCKPESYLEEHPNMKINGILAATGSLGHGLSCSAGLLIADKILKKNNKHIVLMSDGECNEGSVWEAAMFITGKKLKNILVFVDCNKWQATERTNDVLKFEPIKDKWKSFGWKVKEIDGHNFTQIENCLRKFKRDSSPTVVICRTIKGKGVSFMQDNNLWHYRSPNYSELIRAKKELLDH